MSNGSFSFDKNNLANFQRPIQEANSPVVINDRYELLELIGQGAMARVYKALDRVLDRLVAVKVLRDEYGSDANFAARFLREARAIARISSPNIVDIYDYGQFRHTYFIVMSYVEGTNLKTLIYEQRVLAADLAVTIASEVLVGLAAAHSQGIVHRDVKPQNILIRSSDGIAKLTDFGVAYALDGVQITTAGVAIGTAYYMAPEQASAQQIGPYTDLYALGVVLFEMLSGRLPFTADTQLQIMMQHVNNVPPTLRSIGVPVSPELDDIIQKALRKDPAGRFQSALEMRDALLNIPLHGFGGYDGIETFQTSQNLPPMPVERNSFYPPVANPAVANRPPVRKIGILVPALLAIVLLAGLAVAGMLFLSNKGNSTPTSQAVLPVVTPDAAFQPAAATPTITGQPIQALATATAAPTLAPAVLATPTVAPASTATPVPPTATAEPVPTATPQPPSPTPVPPTATPEPPTLTPVPPTPTRVVPTPTQAPPPATSTILASSLTGAYKRDDGTLYGRPEVALYGAGSGYERGSVKFDLKGALGDKVILTLTGLDDERRENCNLQIILNGTVIYNGPSGFPNVPTSDNGEGGNDRFWGQIQISIPPALFKPGSNTLTLSNTTPWTGQLGIPYILVNQIQFTANT